MRHQKLRKLLGAYLDNELLGKEKLRVETHLRACPACRREIDLLK